MGLRMSLCNSKIKVNMYKREWESEEESEIKLAFIKVSGCPFLLEWNVCALLKSVDSACGIQDVFGLWRAIGLSHTSNTRAHTLVFIRHGYWETGFDVDLHYERQGKDIKPVPLQPTKCHKQANARNCLHSGNVKSNQTRVKLNIMPPCGVSVLSCWWNTKKAMKEISSWLWGSGLSFWSAGLYIGS